MLQNRFAHAKEGPDPELWRIQYKELTGTDTELWRISFGRMLKTSFMLWCPGEFRLLHVLVLRFKVNYIWGQYTDFSEGKYTFWKRTIWEAEFPTLTEPHVTFSTEFRKSLLSLWRSRIDLVSELLTTYPRHTVPELLGSALSPSEDPTLKTEALKLNLFKFCTEERMELHEAHVSADENGGL